jgi:hypothetical protein
MQRVRCARYRDIIKTITLPHRVRKTWATGTAPE